jgi:pimeloyl-ACP methyl ester carboxylesterase
VIVELWGHGRSPTPDDPEAYRVAHYIAMFEAIREELGVARWAVCGQSFGAGLTLQYALAHPERVIAQAFTNSLSAIYPKDMLGDDADRRARGDALEQGGIPAIEAIPYHPRYARRFAPEIKQEMEADAAAISPRGIANGIRYTLCDLSVIDRLDRTRVPTLLVNGLWEKAFQPLRAAALARLPTLRVVDLEGGHSINAEAPEAFNAALRQHIENALRSG